VDGEVIEVNEALSTAPEKLNQEPHEGGWLVKVKLSKPEQISELLTAAQYQEYIGA
jgi:glycine cleavage system H protein